MAAGRFGAIMISATILHALMLAPPADGHPSDFGTLTIDLLIAQGRLTAIDAAVVVSEGPSYEPFPENDLKRQVAANLLRTLELPLEGVHVDVEMSELYHEVGFLVRVEESSPRRRVPLRIETGDLQSVATDAGMDRLKLSICGASEESPDDEVLAPLEIRADEPGRAPRRPGSPGLPGLDLDIRRSLSLHPRIVTGGAFGDAGNDGLSRMVVAATGLLVGVALLAVVSRERRQR